jgi:hypothetical protein
MIISRFALTPRQNSNMSLFKFDSKTFELQGWLGTAWANF